MSYIQNTLGNADLAYKMSARCNLPGADQLFVSRFAQLFQSGNYGEAAKVAATAPRVSCQMENRMVFDDNDTLRFHSLSIDLTLHVILYHLHVFDDKNRSVLSTITYIVKA